MEDGVPMEVEWWGRCASCGGQGCEKCGGLGIVKCDERSAKIATDSFYESIGNPDA